jgi:HAD superfamily hydrolase (TIGR01509 family)
MDGTLIDSEPYWIAAESELVASYGGSWSHEDALKLVGNPLIDSGRAIHAAGVELAPEEIVEVLLDAVVAQTKRHIPWLPGARELLTALDSAGVPCALVTMSYARFADVVVGASEGALRLAVAGDDVSNGKPHPEAYLTAAERLAVPIGRCVAIEDSPKGIASAMAAGARTLGVVNQVPLEAQPGLSRVSSLVGVSLDALSRIANGESIDLL